MILKILKLLGLDVPAKVEAIKTRLEQHLEIATRQAGQLAQEAAVVAALFALAAFAGLTAIGVGLVFLYLWVASYYGAYAGLGVVGALLIIATAILAGTAMIKSRSLQPNRIKLPVPPIAPPDTVSEAVAARAIEPAPPAVPTAVPLSQTESAADLVEPLEFFLSKFLRPTTGSPAVDELVANLRAASRGIAGEAVDRAANTIRHGDRANLVIVLSGAALMGWLLGRQAQQ